MNGRQLYISISAVQAMSYWSEILSVYVGTPTDADVSCSQPRGTEPFVTQFDMILPRLEESQPFENQFISNFITTKVNADFAKRTQHMAVTPIMIPFVAS